MNALPIPGQRGGAVSYGVVSDIDRERARSIISPASRSAPMPLYQTGSSGG
jgi:hypothetical protein